MARWKLFIWQGAALLVVAAATVAYSQPLAAVVGGLGVVLLLAGLIGGATSGG